MLPNLSETEARLIGCLMEKSVTTPDQMPLTLNTLTNAANQKSARDPVMALTQSEVQRAMRALADRRLVQVDENFKTGVAKYRQRLCGATSFVDIKLNSAQFAIVTLLLLRGAQTPGELRARAGRLHTFVDNNDVATAAGALIDNDTPETSIVVRLPRAKGRKEAQLMHQLAGVVDRSVPVGAEAGPHEADEEIAALKARVAELEAENAELRALLDDA